jgi:hypothetical protein
MMMMMMMMIDTGAARTWGRIHHPSHEREETRVCPRERGRRLPGGWKSDKVVSDRSDKYQRRREEEREREGERHDERRETQKVKWNAADGRQKPNM